VGSPLVRKDAAEAEMSRFFRACRCPDEIHGYDVNSIAGRIGGIVAKRERRKQ
jgi:hypothetical protein